MIDQKSSSSLALGQDAKEDCSSTITANGQATTVIIKGMPSSPAHPQKTMQRQASSSSFSWTAAEVPLPPGRTGRSVVDYATEDDLRRALEDVTIVEGPNVPACENNNDLMTVKRRADWLLPVPDPEAAEQTVDHELQRLLTLKSYLVLDAAKERAFDELTAEACRYFGTPAALICLVDLGRQFALSNTGCPNADTVRETPRSVAFCAHTILSKSGICVVPDALEDARFRHNELVTGSPHLRFYAGAPLVAPEGFNLGTFCIEGPEPRPADAFTDADRDKLKEFAARAMDLMVERRQRWQTRLSTLQPDLSLRRHAAVATNLGRLLYQAGRCVTAMQLYQESVQTLLHLKGEHDGRKGTSNCDESSHSRGLTSAGIEREEEMAQLLTLLTAASNTDTSREALLEKVASLFPPPAADNNRHGDVCCHGTAGGDGIPGLFSATSKLKGIAARRNSLPGLLFAEAFQIFMKEGISTESSVSDDRNHCSDEALSQQDTFYCVPAKQCSKATLFNMGVIHYHWGSPDSAMHFFDLASSLSKQNGTTALLDFDPVVLACLNNMAQIHLQYGRPNDALELLSDALTRGNAALASIYSTDNQRDAVTVTGSNSSSSRNGSTESVADESERADIRRSRRLRRKLSRTVMNLGHVHFYRCDYHAAHATCRDVLRLLHTDLEVVELAAVWYNISTLHYHQGRRDIALEYMDKFLDRAAVVLPAGHWQISEGLHKKGMILFEMGRLYECTRPLHEALRIRRRQFGDLHESVAESLCLMGRVLQAREEYDFALNAFMRGLAVQQALSTERGDSLSFAVGQTLLEVGRAHHALGDVKASLDNYRQVAAITAQLFGERHPYVARLHKIVGNLCLENGNLDEALRLFEEATRIHVEQSLPIDTGIVQDLFLKVPITRHPSGAPTA